MSEKVNEAGHAFPVSTTDGFTQRGMTLRDYFAAHALQGLLSNEDFMRGVASAAATEDEAELVLATNAFGLAGAMLKAREA